MKKSSLLLATLLMQAAVINSAYAQRDGAYAFDEGYGVRSSLNYLPDGLTGKGVLVGIIDKGIDFNHISFLDPVTNQTRIKAALCFKNPGGDYEFSTIPEEISKFDVGKGSDKEHGTHVAGIAAGSHAADGWQGIATEASLILAEEQTGSDINYTLSLKKMFAVADSLDMPLVVNMSIGFQETFDGFTEMNLLCQELTQQGTAPGRIITVASGNSGKVLAYSHSAIGSDGKARLVLNQEDIGVGFFINLKVGVPKDTEIAFRFFLYNKSTKEEVTEDLIKDSGETVVYSELYKDMICSVSDLSPYRYYNLCTEDIYNYLSDPNIVTCVEISGPTNTELRYMAGLTPIEDDSFAPIEEFWGLPNEYALSPAVISVGNYDSHYEGTPIVPSSSFGVNYLGNKIPDVVAPGCGIISGSRIYDPTDQYDRYGQRDVLMADGSTKTFNWRTHSGTSQSAPLVAGLCALMLEYDPTLTVNRVRELLYSTNDWNEYCENAPMGSDQAGHGLLNTRALFEALMGPTAIEAVSAGVSDNSVYDLFGRRLKDMPAQGTFIRNGKVEIR